jgi:hypothetical protein
MVPRVRQVHKERQDIRVLREPQELEVRQDQRELKGL